VRYSGKNKRGEIRLK